MSKNRPHTKKSAPLKAMSWIAGVTLLAGLAVIAGIYFEQNTRVAGVEFTGNFFTDSEELFDRIESPVGMLADSVNYSEMFSALNALPYVSGVNLSMTMRGRLSFDIKEHEPLALLVNGSDRSYVAAGGIKLPLIPGKIKDVPLLYGFPAEFQNDTLKSDSWKQAEEFLTAAKKKEVSWNTISEIAWNEQEGIVALSHENGVKLVFGHQQFEQRLKHWEVFYSEVVSRKGIRSFRSIDLRFRNQIVTHES